MKQLVDGANGQELAAYVTDPAGRLKSEVRGTTTRSYGWDAGGRLAQTTVSTAIAGGGAGVTTLQYGYDWSGRRVSRTSSDLTTAYLWGDGELVEERLPGRTVLYENGAGMALAAGGERLMYDALGSAVGRVGASGTPALYRYDAWGGYRGSAPGSSDPSAGYAGQHWDGDAGLSYAQQRWYDPRSGRFLSEDPVFGDVQQPNSLHAFGYANGNPLAFTDPSGELGIKPINEADSTRQMDYWWNIYHNAPDGSPQRADALQKYQFWKNEAQDARENIILNEEVVFPLAVDVLAAEVVGPFAKAYRAVRWGLGALSAARGAARLKKAAGEKGTQRTADLIGGAGELAGGGLMFTPELVRVPGAIKQKLSGLGGEQGVKTAPADLAPAPRSLGAAAADDPGLATDESGTLLYRSMKPDTSGGPKIGPSARTLGVRPGAQGDIPVEGDVVKPNTGGMSVTPDDPMGLPSFRRPPGMGGTGKDPVYCISEECLGQSLRYRPDPHRPNEHGFIEPSKPMTLEDFQKALADTVRSWKKVE